MGLRGAAPRGGRDEPRVGSSIYGAVQQLCLAARAYGIGTSLTTLYGGHEDELRELLGLPPDALTMALIPMGYPSGTVGGAQASAGRGGRALGSLGLHPWQALRKRRYSGEAQQPASRRNPASRSASGSAISWMATWSAPASRWSSNAA